MPFFAFELIICSLMWCADMSVAGLIFLKHSGPDSQMGFVTLRLKCTLLQDHFVPGVQGASEETLHRNIQDPSLA